MSEALILTGKRGQGKSLYAISRIREYLNAGRMVATNIDLNMDKLVPVWNKSRAFRLPDFPGIKDLEMLPPGNPDPRKEERNGLLVLDEAAAFLNSRTWNENGKERVAVIAWMAQSRKFGWDLILIAQHARMIDAQIRDSLFELVGLAVRLDKMMIPVLSRLAQWAGFRLRMPKLHRVQIRIGFDPRAPLAESVVFGGTDLFACYDTLQKINPLVGVPAGGGYWLLSHWEIKGRLLSRWQRMKKVVLSVAVGAFAVGLAIGEFRPRYVPVPLRATAPVEKPVKYAEQKAVGVFNIDGSATLVLSDGRRVVARSVKQIAGGGTEYEIEAGLWVK